jgi:RNA polymerase sigma factor (sigma-70 family)
VTADETNRTIDAAWRIESPRLIAGLEQWPEADVPRNPGAWLMAVAKRRAIDQIRRKELFERKLGELGHELETGGDTITPHLDAGLDDHIEDDLLRLLFVSCHPVLSSEARVALTLRLLGGLTTDEIARAFPVSESTVAERIVRAKRTLAKAGVPFEVPEGGSHRPPSWS